MKEQKLISMVEFVKEQRNTIIIEELAIIRNYANFLSQTLSLGMFIPCDENGEVLDEPEKRCYKMALDSGVQEYEDDLTTFEEAKERVLFEGFDVVNGKLRYNGNVVFSTLDLPVETLEEFIILRDVKPTLTQSAIKTIYG